jgi:hypothetical protein
VQSEDNQNFGVTAFPAIIGQSIASTGSNSHGLNFTSRKARFDIVPLAANDDILINQIDLTYDNVMPDIKK